MKKIFIYTALFAALAIACDKTDNEPIQKGIEPDSDLVMITEKVSANVNPSSKANVDADAKFTWLANDQIAVHVNDGNYYTANLTSGAGTNNGTFTVSYPDGQSRDAFAIYPSSIVAADAENYGQSGHSLDVTLPASYTLAQVSGTTTPCPMIAINTPGNGWAFKQLCGFLRLTLNSIPASTKRLEIDFDGKNVAGNFAIPSTVMGDGTSTIALSNASGGNSTVITIKKDGTDVVLGETSLVLNIPLPVGDYSKIKVCAYDAISGGNFISADIISFSYSATRKKAIKKTTTIDKSLFSFTFKDKSTDANLGGLRFVRIFSDQNKLYSGSTTFGPYTVSRANDESNQNNPVEAALKFGSDDGDQLVFQVVTADGKVYSGSYDAPSGGFTLGMYDLTVDVNTYTFTVASGKKVYFSPGDLGVDNGVYSFTEPFETWGWSNKDATKRVWFNYNEVHYANVTPETTSWHEIYGINWRNVKSSENDKNTTKPREWDYIITTRTMNSNVNRYYRVNIPGHGCCLLLTPDETVESDLDGLTEGATITNYVKYFAKGFVLLISTGRATVTSSWSWSSATTGYYWNYRIHQSQARFFITWSSSKTPDYSTSSSEHRMRVRYVHDVE